jgi:hypothetical protein
MVVVRPDRTGRGLLLLGVLALARAACAMPELVQPALAGVALPLRIEDLSGDAFRLLPGVGPVLCARLEAARLAAGGRLHEQAAARVPGVGPGLLARWRALRPR